MAVAANKFAVEFPILTADSRISTITPTSKRVPGGDPACRAFSWEAMVERPARFKVWRPEKAHAVARMEFRGSAHDRGYDSKWSRLSEAYRRKNPFCEECDRWGDDAVTADLVDHILPVRDFPLSRLSWGNLQSLCNHCHGVKGQMEAFARERGKLRDLTAWVKNPEKRPRQFQRPR